MDKIKRLLLYANASKKAFHDVYEDIIESNRTNLKVFSSIACIGMIIMVAASYFDQSLVKNRPVYIFSAVISFILIILALKTSKKKHVLINLEIYVFVALLYGFGIILGTVIEPNEVSVSFPILLFAIPLFFTDSPLRMNLASVIGMIAYIIAAYHTQDSVMIDYNLSNIIPYGIISMVTGTYMMTIKVRRYVLEEQNRYLIESDQLTGLLNRRCYEQHISILREKGCEEGMVICALDINGLKKVNDNLGHHAGDELIIGAANCIKGVFGNYGSCYRTGGDEFMVILGNVAPSVSELKEALIARCRCFNGSYVSGLAISIGAIEAAAEDSIDLLIKIADKEMYADKARYYQKVEN